MQNWKNVWNKQERIDKILLEALLKADGFDSVMSNFSYDQWITYTKKLYSFIGLKDGESVFEVGCGSGAFLFPIQKQNVIGGLDFSEPLIALANKILDGKFYVADASEGNFPKSDVIVSNGVFIYFKDLNFAECVLEEMISSTTKVAILDINDISKEEDYHSCRNCLVGEGYKTKYDSLEHLFFDKQFFIDFATERGWKIKIEDQHISENYPISKFRFNVVMSK